MSDQIMATSKEILESMSINSTFLDYITVFSLFNEFWHIEMIQRDEFKISLNSLIGLEETKLGLKKLLIDQKPFPKSVLVYGPAGSGKTALIKGFSADLNNLNPLFLNASNLTYCGLDLVNYLFELATSNQPSVVIIDDLETLFLNTEQFEDVIFSIQTKIKSINEFSQLKTNYDFKI